MADEPPRLPSPFNSAVECGLRALVVLRALAPGGCDLRRLVIYDYLLVHTDDVPQEMLGDAIERPPSLHPGTPHRSGELLVRRRTLAAGLRLLITKGLAAPRFGGDGITYAETGLTRPFLALLDSDYVRDLVVRGEWVAAVFGRLSDDELAGFANRNLREWGGEFFLDTTPPVRA